jgi:hypothetical protein
LTHRTSLKPSSASPIAISERSRADSAGALTAG